MTSYTGGDGKKVPILEFPSNSRILYKFFSSMLSSPEGTIIQHMECEKLPSFTMLLRTPGILRCVQYSIFLVCSTGVYLYL